MKNKENIIKYLIIFLVVLALAWIIYSFSKNSFHNEVIFKFKSDNIEIKVGDILRIEYELSEDININWESEDNNIVTVNNGVVTGISLGNTLIKGTIVKDNQTITQSCYVSTYIGNKEVSIKNIVVPDGELFISKGDSYKVPISYDPQDGYINSIDYGVTNENIIDFNGTVLAKNIGTANASIVINNTISKNIVVNVVDSKIEPVFANELKEIKVQEDNITLKPNETKKIEYTVEPDNAFIENIKWESSDPKVAAVLDGMITAKGSGETTITLLVNNKISKEIKVNVTVPVTGINLVSNSKLLLKVGQKETIKVNVTPSNATNQKIQYINSSSGNVTIDANGKITAVGKGSGKITVKTIDGNYKVDISYTVNPKKGVINSTTNVWGYSSPLDKTPTRADKDFFKNLVSNGKGTLSGNTYIYTKSGTTYKYDTSKHLLSVGGKSVLARIYYPKGVDLSSVNTFTFCNGTGLAGFAGLLRSLDENRNQLKSSGIIILIANQDGYTYSGDTIRFATEFVKVVVGQKSGVHNAVGGYSGSGDAVGNAAQKGSYDRVVIFDSGFNASATTNVKNKEVIVYSPWGDKLENRTKTMLTYMKNSGYTDVTIVTNNSSIINGYSSTFLVVNPGTSPGGTSWSTHAYRNIPTSKVFSYACR